MDITFFNRTTKAITDYHTFFSSIWWKQGNIGDGPRGYDLSLRGCPFTSKITSLQLYKGDIIKIKRSDHKIFTGKIFWWKAKELRGGMTIELLDCKCDNYKKNNTCKHQTIWFDMWDIVEMIKPSAAHELVDALPFKGSNVELISDSKIKGKVFWRGIGKGGIPSVGFKSNGKSLFVAGNLIIQSDELVYDKSQYWWRSVW